jgi:transportin-3
MLVIPVAVPMLQRMTASFQTTGYSSYIWITSKTIPLAARPDLVEFRQAAKEAFEKQSEKVFSLLQSAPVEGNGDGQLNALVSVNRLVSDHF